MMILMAAKSSTKTSSSIVRYCNAFTIPTTPTRTYSKNHLGNNNFLLFGSLVAPKTTVSLPTQSSSTLLFRSKPYLSYVSLSSTAVNNENESTLKTSNSDDAIMTDAKLSLDKYNNVILFDGVCNFCNTWVDLLLRLDVNEKFKFAPLQSNIGQQLLQAIGKEPDDISSVILIQQSKQPKQSSSMNKDKMQLESYDKSLCVLKVVQDLGPIGSIFSRSARLILPKRFRDGIYDTVATNRYNLMGKRDVCRSGDPKYFDRFIS